ncbi:hypothetical protein MP638_007395 [Amoeboaphelidium occidentale]|nr:hypothetical protein MP638_007395 [Amoeboaphelidium occidentale]
MLAGWIIGCTSDLLRNVQDPPIITYELNAFLGYFGSMISMWFYVVTIMARIKTLVELEFPRVKTPLHNISRIFLITASIPVTMAFITCFLENMEISVIVATIARWTYTVAGAVLIGFDCVFLYVFYVYRRRKADCNGDTVIFDIISTWGSFASILVLLSTLFFAIYAILSRWVFLFICRTFGSFVVSALFLMKLRIAQSVRKSNEDVENPAKAPPAPKAKEKSLVIEIEDFGMLSSVGDHDNL